MIDIENRNYLPRLDEIIEYVNLSLFSEILSYMENKYNALVKIEYSGDKILLGWNVKFKKSGKTLCTVYPRNGHFYLLLIVGSKEKERTEALLPSLSDEFRQTYLDTKEGMGQRWLLFDFFKHSCTYDDVMKIVHIRQECKK